MTKPDIKRVIPTTRMGQYCVNGYARDVPYGCYNQGLLSVLYFLPGQAMAPHRHLDSDEYFTAVMGDAEMIVNGQVVPLPHEHTFLRRRGVLHAIRNPGPQGLVVQSFQAPVPQCESIIWEQVEGWTSSQIGCARCWCGQFEDGSCVNCGAAEQLNLLA
jgi:mannose-6-phosphate isomerase-like protein (cupin superfamily)